MANEEIAPVETVEPVQATETAPLETPTVEAVVEPVVTETVVEPTESVTPDKTETLLGEDEPEAPKTEVTEGDKEVKNTESETPEVTEGDQSDEPAPSPKYDPFELPEGVSLAEDRVGKFTEILSDLELEGKVPHELVQKFGQKAVDFYLNEVGQAVNDYTQALNESWENQKTAWKDQFLNDPEIGGNRFQTTVDSARTFIRTHGGTPEQQAEFRSLMESSGLGNHPTMIRLLANAGAAMTEGRPLAATKPVSAPKSKTATMYGGKS